MFVTTAGKVGAGRSAAVLQGKLNIPKLDPRYAGPPNRAGMSKDADSATESERVMRSPM